MLIDDSAIGNLDLRADRVLLVQNRDGHRKAIRILTNILPNGAVCSLIYAPNRYLDAILIKGQSLAHGIGDLIGIRSKAGVGRHLAGDGVVDGLTHLHVGLVGFLLKGHIVLIVDGDLRVGGGQVAQCAGGAGDEVVAQGEAGNRGNISLLSQLVSRVPSRILVQLPLQIRSKVGRAELVIDRIVRLLFNRCAGYVLLQAFIRPRGVVTYFQKPRITAIYSYGVRIVIPIVGDIKNLVGGIGLAFNGIRNGNGAGGGCSCFSGKGCGGQGEDHDQCQQETGELSCVFHFLCSFFHHHFEFEWWLSAYQEDASSSFRCLQWIYNRVAAPKISARPPAV